LQDISYQYDAVGNIKQIIDDSSTDARKTVAYTYDDLYRLTSAVATNTVNSQNYTETFVYDAIGNILSQTTNDKTTTYNYQGNLNNIGSNYANPDAVTQTAGDVLTSYKYDRNGNMTGQGLNIYKYDYNNRLVSAAVPQESSKDTLEKLNRAVSSYAYDSKGQRIKRSISGENPGGVYYPTMYYNISSVGEAVKHIFANNIMLATINGTGQEAQIYTDLTDHLSGASVVLNSNNEVVETTDYYSFGAIRLDNPSSPAGSSGPSAFSEQRKYIGQEYDEDTGLNYLNARYYNSAIARFVTQDPVALAVGNEQEIKQITGQTQQALLANPQALNYYAYAGNNPITKSDPTGKCAWDACAVEIATSPMWAPAVTAGAITAVSVAGYYAYSVYNSVVGKLPKWTDTTPKWRGQRQIPDVGIHGTEGPSGDKFSSPNSPKWGKWGYIGLLGVAAVADIISQFDNIKESFQKIFIASDQNQESDLTITSPPAINVISSKSITSIPSQPKQNIPSRYYSAEQKSTLQQQIYIFGETMSPHIQTNKINK